MSKWREKFKTWNFENKMRFFLSWAIFGTSMAILIVSTLSAISSNMKQTRQMATEQLSALASNYEDNLEQYKTMATALTIDKTIQEYCQSNTESNQYPQKVSNVYYTLLNMLNVQKNMNFIVVDNEITNHYIYKGNSSVVDSRYELMYQQDYQESILAKEKGSMRISFTNYYFRTGKYTLTLYVPIYSTVQMNHTYGMLVMNLNDSFLDQLSGVEHISLNSEIYLIDTYGKIVSVSDSEKMGQEALYMDQIQGLNGSFWKQGKLINYQKVNDWNYYLITEIAAFDLYKESLGVAGILFGVVTLMTLFSIYLLRRMITAFYKPINKVVSNMDSVSEGKLDVRISLDHVDTDSKKLADGFNTMMDEINTLMEQVKQEQHQIEQIRFNALQSQIQPHFLYNTLECIHWQALADGNKEISTMVKALAQYYRVSLSKGRDIISLKAELDHVKSYLVIQNMRYGNIVELVVHIPEVFYNIQIPKITLQPLVENSIYHGIKVKEGKKGQVTISIREEEEEVYLLVEDSGTGMSQEEIEHMNEQISIHDETFGYGVRNVNRRIELLFGKPNGLYYTRNEGGGVTVVIRLPKDSWTDS